MYIRKRRAACSTVIAAKHGLQTHPSRAHFNFYDFARLTTTNILSDLYHAARERVLWRNIASIFWFRFMQFHGTRLGYCGQAGSRRNSARRFIMPVNENQRISYSVMLSRLGIMEKTDIDSCSQNCCSMKIFMD